MIAKALFLFFVLVSLYCISIQVVQPSLRISLNQWQTNLVKAQNFLYTADSCRNVVVGSSLSARLDIPELCNLSFVGLSAFDGMRMLQSTDYKLDTIYIETNILLRSEDEVFTAQLTNPFLFQAKKHILALREGKQPLAILIKESYEGLQKLKRGNKKTVTAPAAVDPALFDKLLANQVLLYSTPPTNQALNNSMVRLHAFVKEFEERGAQVVFFEMPVHKKLCNLPVSISLREYMHKTFPPNRYNYIVQPDCGAYHTTDGVHLSEQEALHYLAYFQRHCSRLTSFDSVNQLENR
ncbi:hypothetical protein [Spirosoma validum]|uniref:Uncharacterized protein n=1 Tax=Spirosoma validum TaxID=2771355 RepID=A0A927B555_9BACT|nr:hypothetical protein [Spirosoma validum]MBD2755826.1 hypothetical protein [Spirosoma validum]